MHEWVVKLRAGKESASEVSFGCAAGNQDFAVGQSDAAVESSSRCKAACIAEAFYVEWIGNGANGTGSGSQRVTELPAIDAEIAKSGCACSVGVLRERSTERRCRAGRRTAEAHVYWSIGNRSIRCVGDNDLYRRSCQYLALDGILRLRDERNIRWHRNRRRDRDGVRLGRSLRRRGRIGHGL